MTDSTQPSTQAQDAHSPLTQEAGGVLHRVCIQCNNMFRVKPEKYDAKQCPNCHKG